jgi:thiamine phosphate synthase YjbQ (UPF0047 family)
LYRNGEGGMKARTVPDTSGNWQGIYLAEHRTSPRRREVVLQFIGSRR